MGIFAKREGVSFRIDHLLVVKNERFVSLRSISRLFNVDAKFCLTKKRVVIRQPGRFFVTLRGDTLQSISRLLNTTVKKLLAVNTTLREPIASGIKVIIPTVGFRSLPRKRTTKTNKTLTIKQQTELAGPIISLGRSLLGTKYKFGARPYPISRRFDCSSYIQYIFKQNGIHLPRTSRAQASSGRSIQQRNVEPGDLIFFRRNRYSDNRIGHVGIDIGNGRMLNTYKSPPGVTITRWRSPLWLKRYVKAREII
ncbi:NlpC/P60 family protein [Brevibacillus choshinensis]|nr:NlpC/P60 family protein [Brevibacillus choshinensis]